MLEPGNKAYSESKEESYNYSHLVKPPVEIVVGISSMSEDFEINFICTVYLIFETHLNASGNLIQFTRELTYANVKLLCINPIISFYCPMMPIARRIEKTD